ncbi:peptidyl-prolyl cis-trans isomerase [Punctularia strigosozonata HHB-11173 SS5]|uniref:peptidyl-prolyl cis-trans isomerase n=1 Tax=Punctularia strigosozonata (strain HHB-11173) TaxID=741275 RepID=UPI0004416B4C|nr:peptidyl-prolyl cis-trans isomerase [Punctularia strigosozonata HHB-11173 SS5]EIN12739.1 peptidyl-prolyl cis-trans isomerase [Punctularia strigosozonata HHB-11173 SS5]
MPQPAGDGAVKKKRKVLPHEKLYLEHLPSADRYYKSFMHREVINFCVMTKTEFLITTSVDGHLKFWKKQESGIEFVKHYRAHLTQIVAVSASVDGQLFASAADDGSVKVFDVGNFDMINMINLPYIPHACCWVHRRGQAQGLLAVSEQNSGIVRIYDGRGDGTPLETLDKLHRFPVHVMTYNDRYDTVISADEEGFVEYWRPSEPFEPPKSVPGLWSFKSSTDLYEFKKSKSTPTCITLSPDMNSFATFSLPDRQIRIFSFLSGKLTRKYDESLTAIQEMQQAGTAVYKVEDMEFGRRLAVEKELDLPGPDGKIPGRWINVVWDESGAMLLYPTLLGIKVVNTVTNRVVRLLGKDETVRWMNLALYQGAPAKKGLTTTAMAASANPLLAEKGVRDPTLFCTGYKRQRFYIFSRSEPEDEKSDDRDVFNEKPTRDELTIASNAPAARNGPSPLANSATIHTTLGDIHIRLFPQQAPKAVENFVGHSRSGYFEGVIFHRVIPKFMIQTGDPLGDGTGGTSIWGHEFEDEFSDDLKHDRPYAVSMANAGPGTNGSQFFITTNATPWLDRKHTIFGRVLSGMETVHAIENVKTNKLDKPYEDIKIINIDVE